MKEKTFTLFLTKQNTRKEKTKGRGERKRKESERQKERRIVPLHSVWVCRVLEKKEKRWASYHI